MMMLVYTMYTPDHRSVLKSGANRLLPTGYCLQAANRLLLVGWSGLVIIGCSALISCSSKPAVNKLLLYVTGCWLQAAAKRLLQIKCS